jgi:cell division protein FtsB
MATIASGMFLFAGCQESDASQIRRARLVANENIQLKKQLQEKDQQIEELKKQIEQIETESAEAIEKSGEASGKTLRLLLESEKSNEALILENERLKEEIEKLKAQ